MALPESIQALIQKMMATPEGKANLAAFMAKPGAAGLLGGSAGAATADPAAGAGLDYASILAQGQNKDKLGAMISLLGEMRQRRQDSQPQISPLGSIFGKLADTPHVAAGGDLMSVLGGLIAAKEQDHMQRNMLSDLVGGRLIPLSSLSQSASQGNITDDLASAKSILDSILGTSTAPATPAPAAGGGGGPPPGPVNIEPKIGRDSNGTGNILQQIIKARQGSMAPPAASVTTNPRPAPTGPQIQPKIGPGSNGLSNILAMLHGGGSMAPAGGGMGAAPAPAMTGPDVQPQPMGLSPALMQLLRDRLHGDSSWAPQGGY